MSRVFMWSLPLRFSNQISSISHLSHVYYMSHSIFLDLITLTTFSEDYKL
jgi:hypothetical protein